MEKKNDGQTRYQEYWAKQMGDPDFRRVYEEEARRKELWLQLVEAREADGLTQQQVAAWMGVSQAQVARIEKRGYESQDLRKNGCATRETRFLPKTWFLAAA